MPLRCSFSLLVACAAIAAFGASTVRADETVELVPGKLWCLKAESNNEIVRRGEAGFVEITPGAAAKGLRRASRDTRERIKMLRDRKSEAAKPLKSRVAEAIRAQAARLKSLKSSLGLLAECADGTLDFAGARFEAPRVIPTPAPAATVSSIASTPEPVSTSSPDAPFDEPTPDPSGEASPPADPGDSIPPPELPSATPTPSSEPVAAVIQFYQAGCSDYFLAMDSQARWYVIQWISGFNPAQGQAIAGTLLLFGFTDVRYPGANAVGRVWIDDFALAQNDALMLYEQKCVRFE